MSRALGLLGAGVLGLWVAGCAVGARTRDDVVFVPQSFSWKDPACDSSECASVFVEYPSIQRAPTTAASESLQAFILAFALRRIDDSTQAGSFDSLVQGFRQAYDGFKRDLPDEPLVPWHVERKISVLATVSGVFSLSCQEYTYLGGVHPTATVRLVSFDAHSGRRLRVPDLLAPGSEDAMVAVGERAFRRVREITGDLPINEAGFWFEGGRFNLPDNFAITSDGLRFVFNAYDVAPYVIGPTDFGIPFGDIRPLLRRDGPLASQAAKTS